MSYRPSHNLLIVSDLHLGADLKRSGFAFLRGVATLDREFGRFLEWYGAHVEGGLPWRLIVNGDMVDFINVTLLPKPGEAPFEVDEAEHRFGLAGTEAKVGWMLDRILERHRALFDKLAAFVAAGHEIAIVRGNHDVEWHFPGVQDRFRAGLAEIAGRAGDEAFLGRITFLPWFYYEPGTIFVEHGHQYDEYSSFEYLLAPVSAEEPKRVDLPLSHFAIRYLANAFPNISTHDKDHWTLRDYVRLAFSGKSGSLAGLGAGYVATLWRVARVVVRRKLRRASRVRDEHVRALRSLAEQWSLPLERLRSLERLHRGNALRSAWRAAQCYYADRFAVFFAAIVSILVLLDLGLPREATLASISGCLFATLGANRLLASTRKAEIPPKLRQAGRAVALLMNVPLVVMGHSHKAAMVGDASARAQYVNTGTWIPPGEHSTVAGFTHLMVRRGPAASADGGTVTVPAEAELRQWNAPESRPIKLES